MENKKQNETTNEKVGIFASLRNADKRFRQMSLEELNMVRNILILLVVGDIFGVWWYLGLDKLGGAILIVVLAIFTYVLIIEKEANKEKMEEENNNEDKPEEDLGKGNRFLIRF